MVILVGKDVILGPAHRAQLNSAALAVVVYQRKHSFVTNFTRATRQKKLRFCATDLVQLYGLVDGMSVDDLAVHWLR